MKNYDAVTGLPEGAFGFGTFETGGRVFPGIVQYGGAFIDISDSFVDCHAILDDWERNFDRLVAIEAGATASDMIIDQVRPLPPLSHPCIHGGGSNYRQHVVEMLTHGPYSKRRQQPGETLQAAWDRNAAFVDHRAAHGMPIFWTGMHSSLCGANDDIVLPALGKNHDWEMELGVVIGSSRRFATFEEAESMIAGYVAVNDLGTLDQYQRPDMPWQFDMYIKNQPTFKVAGPFIVPAPFIDRDEIIIKLAVNGETKQDWPVTDQIFSCEKMVAYTSERTRLLPGDLILTGSPPGNASLNGDFLKDGDVVTASLTGLGRQHNRCIQEVLEPGRKPMFGFFDHEAYSA